MDSATFPSGNLRRWFRCCWFGCLVEQRSEGPRGGGGFDARLGARPREDAGGYGSNTAGGSRVQSNDMCREKREHVEIPDTFELSSELGPNGFAVVLAGDDVYIWATGKAAGYPSPLPVREGAVYAMPNE